MNNKKILIAALIIVVLAQIIIPVRMIRDNEKTIITGEEFKFRIILPRDREQMINIRSGRFYANEILLTDGHKFTRGEIVYVGLKVSEEGFAEVASVSGEKAESKFPCLKAKVSFVFADSIGKMLVNYPFEQDYNDMTNSSEFTTVYRDAVKNMSVIYALVSIRNRNAILKDIFIDGISLHELAKNKNQNLN